MMIELVGALPRELKDRGLKAGDVVNAQPSENSRLGAMQFRVKVDDDIEVCTVFQENYVKK